MALSEGPAGLAGAPADPALEAEAGRQPRACEKHVFAPHGERLADPVERGRQTVSVEQFKPSFSGQSPSEGVFEFCQSI